MKTPFALAALAVLLPAVAGAADRIDVYPLDTCAVARSKLGSMGDAVVFQHEGREVRFCCEKCTAKFQAEPAKFLASVDERIIAQQKPSYPLTTCPISGEALDADAHEFVVKNRLVRTCCKECAGKVKAAPDATLAKIDEAIVAAQKKDYPVETCAVSGEKLGSMGDPVDVVVGHRLIRLCCKGCKKELVKDPVAALAAVEAAWAKKSGKGAAPPEKAKPEGAAEGTKPGLEKKPDSGATGGTGG